MSKENKELLICFGSMFLSLAIFIFIKIKFGEYAILLIQGLTGLWQAYLIRKFKLVEIVYNSLIAGLFAPLTIPLIILKYFKITTF